MKLAIIVSFALSVVVSGVTQAQTQSLDDLRKAAQDGDNHAEFSFAMRLKDGDGVTKNPQGAFCWMHRAAEHGYPGAWFSVAIMYAMGDGIAKDNVEAYKWFTLDAEHSPTTGGWGEFKSHAAEDAALIEKHMTPDQVREAKAQASRWWQAVVARGPIKSPNQQYVRFPGDRPPC